MRDHFPLGGWNSLSNTTASSPFRREAVWRGAVESLSNHPEVGVVCSDWDMIGGDGRWLGGHKHKVLPVAPGLKYITRTLRSGRSSVGCPGAMIRRSALGEIRFGDHRAIGFGDFVVWFRLVNARGPGILTSASGGTGSTASR